MTVRLLVCSDFVNFTWLPRRLESMNPAANSLRLTSRYENSLGGTDLDLDRPDRRRDIGARRFEVKFQRLREIRQGFVLVAALAGDIHVETLGDHEITLAPQACLETFFHIFT